MSERKQRISFQSGPRISKSLLFGEKNKQTNKQTKIKNKKEQMSWAEIFGQIGFHCDFFVFLRDHLLMRESFNFQPTTKKVIYSARNLFQLKIQKHKTMAS